MLSNCGKTLGSSLDSKEKKKKTNQSIIREINSEYSLEKLTLKLKLQYCGHLVGRIDLLERTLMLERLKAKGEEGAEDEVVR